MQFEKAYGEWKEGKLTQQQAAFMLGVCSRTFRRYLCRYEEKGIEGLLDKRLTQASLRREPVDEVLVIVRSPQVEQNSLLY
jgi:transposase